MNVMEDHDYRKALKKHYTSTIEFYFIKNRKIETLCFRVIFSLVFSLSIFELLTSFTFSYLTFFEIAFGVLFWSFCFMCVHVNFHLHMWKHRATLNQKIFPFYHHYVDPMLYSKYRHNYHAAHLNALIFIILPMFYVNTIVAAMMFFSAALDLYTHQWYHTREADKKKHFNFFLFYLRCGFLDANI